MSALPAMSIRERAEPADRANVISAPYSLEEGLKEGLELQPRRFDIRVDWLSVTFPSSAIPRVKRRLQGALGSGFHAFRTI